jgi:hypothetical protein
MAMNCPVSRWRMIPFVLVVVWPGAVVWAPDYLVQVVRGQTFDPAMDLSVRLSRTMVALIPFLILAVFAWYRLRHRATCEVAGIRVATGLLIAGALAVWGTVYLEGLLRPGDPTNFHIAMVLMFSPFYLSVLIPVGFWLGMKYANNCS